MIQEIEAATAQLSALIDRLTAMIATLPENPRLGRINDRCFVVRNLGDNWTPEYHDFRCQYQAVIDAIKRTKTVDAVDTLRSIIAAGRVRYSRCIVKLHPDVIANLRSL